MKNRDSSVLHPFGDMAQFADGFLFNRINWPWCNESQLQFHFEQRTRNVNSEEIGSGSFGED